MRSNLLLKLIRSDFLSVCSGIFLSMMWGAFAYTHLARFLQTWQFDLLLFTIAETITAAFFLIRSDPKTVSLDPYDWLVAICGTFAPLFFRPASWGILPFASNAIILGLAIQILAMLSLNRSFALVAAKRELKTTGMYKYVRHPIYASYVITLTAYLFAHSTMSNLLVYMITMSFLFVRACREEHHLSEDRTYCEYMKKVRYRIIPYIF